MSVRNQSRSKSPIPEDFTKALGPSGITALLKLMRDAYFELRDKKIVSMSMSENDITEEWVVCLMQLWRNSSVPSSIVPIHEKQDKSKARQHGRPPTIDFCFRADWDKKSYFGAECKLIEANNKKLCDAYISDGLQRYLDGKYSSAYPEGAMIGYIRQTRCIDVANEISLRIGKMKGIPEFDQSNLLLPFDEYYISRHSRRIGFSSFFVHHLLFLFEHPSPY